jgi:hypothetical protein
MNRGVLRSDADLRNEDGAALLWTGTSSGVQVTPVGAGPVVGASVAWPASANTLTSWVEITASSPFACCAIDVYFSGHYQSGADTALLFDIGIGPPTETVLIDGIPSFGHSRFLSVRFPVRVAASTRFTFRVQARTAAGSLTSPADPTVAIGFIRDIPEFPAGTSVATIGSVDRAASTYDQVTGWSFSQFRNVWGYVGDVPAGKMIYAIPCCHVENATILATSQLADFGWTPESGTTYGTIVGNPQEVFCADQWTYADTAEAWNPVIPTVWLPDGYTSGGIVASVDVGNTSARRPVVFAVME